MKVRYTGSSESCALIKNKIYEVISVEKGWYRVMSELDEDYLFPPSVFEIYEDENQIFAVNIAIYGRIYDLGGILAEEKHEFSTLEDARMYAEDLIGLKKKSLKNRLYLPERIIENSCKKIISKLSLYIRVSVRDSGMSEEQYIERHERALTISNKRKCKFWSEWEKVENDWNDQVINV